MKMVSIVVPNFNKGKLVGRALESILAQTFENWEAIVVDDSSSDESWVVIQEFVRKDSRIVALRNDSNKGGCYSRNRGAAAAKGKYLIFLDSDDWLAEDCIARRVEEFECEKNESLDMLIFEMATSRDGKIGRNWNFGSRKNAALSFLRHEIVWQTMMPIWRREAFERIGGFDESFPRLQDVELHTRALLSGVSYRFAERKTPDCFYFIEDSRLTMNHDAMAKKFVKAILQYVDKMSAIVCTSIEHKALVESLMAAIRVIGDSYQAGRVDESIRGELYDDILGNALATNWVRLYAWAYSLWLNKLHGFNYLYRKIYRILAMLCCR